MNKKNSIYGDIRYDISKLSHSIIGLYDFIISNRYNLIDNGNNNYIFNIETNNNVKIVQKLFLTSKLLGSKILDFPIYQIMIHLFLSMIPLHKIQLLDKCIFM